jgi:glucose/arabinose dehydrogenase
MKAKTAPPLLVLLALSIGPLAGAEPAELTLGGSVTLVPVVSSGLSSPIGIVNAGDGSGRLFVLEQPGRIRIVKGTQLLATPFLDITSLTGCSSGCGERGLLGLAFHPSYATNGRFFVYYTRADGDIQVARYQVSASNPDVANPAGTVLLTIEHSSQSNHNGGQLAFGPDGFLYIGTGDGGGGGDPFENGQNKNALLAKILRLDVDSGSPYGIPATNPFAGATDGADEVWDYGLRNPWRFSFDRQTGDLYIGDVGQGAWEEVDLEPAGNPGGRNYGWDCREGAHNYNDTNGDMNVNCGSVTSVDPVLEYGHSDGCSITGGYVYRGRVPSFLTGQYIFSDYCSGKIWYTNQAGGWARPQLPVPVNGNVTSFGQGETGRLYVIQGSTVSWLTPYTFTDVPPTSGFWPFVEAIAAAGITDGCGGTSFCPGSVTTRAEMAVFLLAAKEGPSYMPPACTTPAFADVPCTSPFAAWINELARRGITAGCGGGNYCPSGPVTRGQMAVFLLATKEGTGYTPPACVTPRFNDVPCSSGLAPWVNEIAARGITAGCGAGNYCPAESVTRGQMSVFISGTFGLPLP